ncbi:MAG TPA: zinc-dependent metalloprotease family protein [Fluviicola sp.]|nr:zinc-dependent metalloprotease family protein [Fluviicola sp.]
MKNSLHLLGAILLVASCNLRLYAQEKHEKGPWRKIEESAIPSVGTRYIQPTKYLTFKLDVEGIRAKLNLARRIDDPSYLPVFIELPKADGTFGYYQVHENTTMHPDLAAAFPEIRAFDGVPTDGSGEIVKLDLTPQGFHAMILYPNKPTTFIDPYSFGGGDIEHYIIYSKADFVSAKTFQCHVDAPPTETIFEHGNPVLKSFGSCQKRTYRLALAATAEYTTFQGGTVALAQAAQVTTMNRVNGVYMRDMAITMTIIANNNLLIYTNAGSDPYTNGNPGSMITQNQTNVTNVIGSANYDIGHVFGTNSGGLAGLGVVCSSSQKARGVTGSGAPVGDPFDIDYVAHEMGHEFDGNHTFRGNAGSCSGNANGATAMEPGSGSTIMAYAGICSPMDVQSNSDDHFHGISLEEIGGFITSAGHTCPVVTTIPSQTAPTISGTVGNVTIPANTPFALTATATDPDGDVLTYCWEQMDNQNSTQPPVSTSTNGPNFRSYSPTTNPTRYFPSIPSILAGGPFTWEVIPTVNRTMNFRVVVRDNEANGGCNDHDDITITTTTSAGPFVVNYPSAAGITWPGNSTQTVTWSVANTTASPVSCANVDILISLDGGATFTNIANNVPNDGSQSVTVPNTSTANAIIMVICENGTFFDISNNVFAITAATNDYSISLTNSTVSACQGSNGVFTVQIGQIGSYTDPVTLSATGLAAGLSASFSPNPVTPGNSSTMTISGTAGVSPGTYPFTVQGNSTSGIHTTPATIVVSTNSSVVSTLLTPANGEPSAALPLTLTWSNPNAGMLYDIQIATDAGFASIVESATGLTSPNYTATLLVAATTYYWRVNSYNSCSSAGNSTTFSFTTSSCGTFSSTNVPVSISASGTPTVTSTLNIPTNATINDLNVVNLVGTHTYIEDLTFTLTSPQGTSVTLFGGICTDNNNFNVELDDEAASATLPCPPTDGNAYQPTGSLADFDGEDMSGTWTLTVADGANQDGGSLTSWGLEICYTPSIPCNDPDNPTISGTTSFCTGGNTTLTISSGNLNDATDWEWYSGSCGGTSVGSGTTLNVSTPGTYYVRGEGGCVTPGTCQSVVITQNTVNTATTLVAGVLSSSQNGGTYQWVDCNNGNAAVPGATSQTFIPTVNGSYAVQVTAANGCSGTSNCVAYNVVGVNEFDDLAIQLYPNPTTGIVTVSFGGILVPVQEMTVTDVTGRLVREQSQFTTDSMTIDLSRESKGVYFLNVQVGGRIQTMKITKN